MEICFSLFVMLAADNPTAIESNQTFILQFKVYLRTSPLFANGSKLLSDHRHLDFDLVTDLDPVRHPWRFAECFCSPGQPGICLICYAPAEEWIFCGWIWMFGIVLGFRASRYHAPSRANWRIHELAPLLRTHMGFSYYFFAPLFLCGALNVYRLFIIIIYLFALVNTHARSRNDTY